ISSMSALMACSSSLPLVSTMTFEPLAAASIITPMMLFALTRRPLRESQISLWKLPANWVSLADARACSPNLLMISTSCCCISQARWRHMDDALDPTRQRLAHHHVELFLPICQRSHEHRKAHSCHAFHAPRDQ